MEAAAAKLIGAGIACIGMGGAGVGVSVGGAVVGSGGGVGNAEAACVACRGVGEGATGATG